MEKLSLSAWLDEANASNLSFGRFACTRRRRNWN